MNDLPADLVVKLAALLRDYHADGLYGLTLGLLGDLILPEARKSAGPAMLDTATMRQLIKAFGQQGRYDALPAVLTLLEPYLPALQRTDPILLSVAPSASIALNPAVTLSGREIQVLVGIANGLTNSDIGRVLHLSADTIKTHNQRMFRKLGAKDRAHAVRLAFDAGVLPIRRRVAPSAVA